MPPTPGRAVLEGKSLTAGAKMREVSAGVAGGDSDPR